MSFIEKFKGKISHLGKDGLGSLLQNPDHPIFKDDSSKPKLKIITSTKQIKMKMIPSEPITPYTPYNKVMKGNSVPSVTSSAKLESSRLIFERKRDPMMRKKLSIQIRRKNEGIASSKELTYFSDMDELMKPKPHSFIIRKKIEQKKEEGGGGKKNMEGNGRKKREKGREEEEGRMKGIDESQKKIISYLENLEMLGGRVVI